MDRASGLPAADAVTAVAIGILSAPLMFLAHELLGHGVATLVVGAHIVRVTSVNESWNGDVSAVAARAIAAAGIVANLLVGAVALFAFRFVPKARAGSRLFLWFFGHATVFMGSGYLIAGAIFRFGDVPQVLHDVPFETAWRIGAATFGSIVFESARRSAERTLDGWVGNERRRARARTFSLRIGRSGRARQRRHVVGTRDRGCESSVRVLVARAPTVVRAFRSARSPSQPRLDRRGRDRARGTRFRSRAGRAAMSATGGRRVLVLSTSTGVA